MPDYSKGKIYTIRCKNDPSLIYVGSTIQPLAKRWGGHKIYSLKHPNILIYSTINNDWDNWYIELYEECPCENKEQLCKKEGEIIRLIGNLNIRIEGRTKKEYNEKYYNDNKDKVSDYNKEYRLKKIHENPNYDIERQVGKWEKHKDKYNAKIICDCGKEICKRGLNRHLKSKIHITE